MYLNPVFYVYQLNLYFDYKLADSRQSNQKTTFFI